MSFIEIHKRFELIYFAYSNSPYWKQWINVPRVRGKQKWVRVKIIAWSALREQKIVHFSLIWGKCLPLWAYKLNAHSSCLGRSHLQGFLTAVSLQGGREVHMEETIRRVKPRQRAVIEGWGSSNFFLNPEPIRDRERGNVPIDQKFKNFLFFNLAENMFKSS